MKTTVKRYLQRRDRKAPRQPHVTHAIREGERRRADQRAHLHLLSALRDTDPGSVAFLPLTPPAPAVPEQPTPLLGDQLRLALRRLTLT